ncbi:MAG: elongation factor G [Sedimentisphaerales bacterium]|nr:elongation factor G [Sedimentisphaerales bacterium]
MKKLRNIGIIAHIDAGKTTVTERVLYYTGKTYKMGEVHNGTAVMDYMQEEQQRGITITSAATKFPWKDFYINLIDTPGHIDFTAEVERSLRVLDGAIVVFDASEGVQAQSETVWRQGQKYSLPYLCFINKMDKVGADFEMTIESIRNKLMVTSIILQFPIGAGPSFAGIVDLIKMKAVFYRAEKLGAVFEETDIPQELVATAETKRHQMLELAAEADVQLMDAYVHDRDVEPELINAAIRKGTLTNRFCPVFVGSALKYIGVQRLLDAVVEYLPCPLDKGDIEAHKPQDENKKVAVKCDKNGPLVALVFKVASDAHGDLSFVRIYQGTLKSNTRVLNANQNRRENITRIFEMHAKERKILNSASAGDIVAVVGLKHTLTGDTICDPRKPLCLPTITFPQTVISMSIEPKTSTDASKLAEALSALRKEDPTFQCNVDRETGQMIISGMGELHLEVLQHKLTREKKLDVRVGKPTVAYKEAITKLGRGQGKFVRQTGGRGQYGHVVLTVEPVKTKDGHWDRHNSFESKVGADKVPKEFIPAVERGAKNNLASGALAGYAVIGTKITLIDGSFHTVDSSEIAFEQAGAMAMEEALKKADPVLLEPFMHLQATIPEGNFGSVQSNLLAKRAVITDCKTYGAMRIIDAKVPLAEMFGYSSQFRSNTAGRGMFTMEPLCYERVPEQVARQIII